MPYRRLPNTDSARLRAMQKALSKSEDVLPMDLPYSAATLQELRYFLPEFNQAIMMQRDVFERQTSKNKQHQESFRKARLYISHFIQVLNFAIARGEMKPDTRKYFDLPSDETKLPQLNTERDVIEWGQKLIDGEQKRLSEGLSPVTNPTIARVKVHYEDFVRLNISQKGLQETTPKLWPRFRSCAAGPTALSLICGTRLKTISAITRRPSSVKRPQSMAFRMSSAKAKRLTLRKMRLI